MQKEQRASFLQININAQKFNLFTASLNSIINSQQKQIIQNSKQIAQIKFMVDDKITRLKTETQYQIQQVNKKWKEELLFQSCMDNDFKAKQQDAVQSLTDIICSLQQSISSLGHKINHQIYRKMDQDFKQSEFKSQKALEDVFDKIKLMENQIKNSVNLNQEFFQNVMQTCNKGYSDKGTNDDKMNIILTPRKINQQIKKSPRIIPFLNRESSDDQKLRQKKKKRQQKHEQENLKYATISAKIQSLQGRVFARENQKLNTVMMPRKRSDSIDECQKNISISMGNIEPEKSHFEKNTTLKLLFIENKIEQNRQKFYKHLQGLEVHIQKLMGKMQTFQRKIQKQKHRINEIALQARYYQQKRTEQRGIEAIIITFRKQLRSLEQNMQEKVNNEQFQKEKKILHNKLAATSQTLIKKAETQEIKKAFQFIQHKIKEIVTLLAEEMQPGKQGAIKKIPLKCLSCDKSQESSLLPTMRGNGQKTPTSRCPTSKIRRKIRITNDNIQKCLQ